VLRAASGDAASDDEPRKLSSPRLEFLGLRATELDPNQFELWRERVVNWLATAKAMRQLHVDVGSTRVEAEGMHGLSESLSTVLQRCNAVREVSLHHCTLSNYALTSLCQVCPPLRSRARTPALLVRGPAVLDARAGTRT
jgi:hypothetical protein